MPEVYHQDKIFEKEFVFEKGEYESCEFNFCHFENISLSGSKFINCVFKSCNLSLAKLHDVAWQNVSFLDCKMLGLRFDECNSFGISLNFDHCQLLHASFYGMKIKKTTFKECKLNEVDFTSADLRESSFLNCDFTNAIFENTHLDKTDFSTSYNYSIDPEMNRIKKARFSLQGIKGLLYKHDIIVED